mgnify:CR=1 FL=1
MNLGFVGAQNQLLTSWRSSDDPAIGDYSFGMDPNEKGDFFYLGEGQCLLEEWTMEWPIV